MSLYVKSLVQKGYERSFEGVESFLVLQTVGIDGISNNQMRGELKSKGVKMTVVRNAMMRRALASLGMPQAGDLFGTGPCTIVYGGDSIVDVAKNVQPWVRKIKALAIKGACVEGQSLDSAQAGQLASMPNRAELQGQVVQLAISPGARLAGAIAGPGGVIAGCIKTLIENKEKEAA